MNPASTKVSVFVAVDGQDGLNIDSVQLQVDNRPVANYLYTAGEQEALRRGGVQQLYLGNVTIGPHQLSASFIGKDATGAEKRGTVNSKFDKDVAAKSAGQDVLDKLVAKVKNGGSGVWGPVPMPPNVNVSEADIKTIVTWILSLK